MEGKFLFNKKLMILAIFFVSLLAVSTASAVDNVTDAVVGVDETTDEIICGEDAAEIVGADENPDINAEILESKMAENNNDLSVMECDGGNKVSSGISNNDILGTGSYLKNGDYGHIESNDAVIVSPNKFKVQLVGDNVNNQNVYFTVYDSDQSGKYVGDYVSKSDYYGHATLNTNLNWGHYWIKISTDDHGSVYNSLTVRPNGYKNVKIVASNAKYKKNNYIDCSWKGIFNGYLKICKGSKVVKKISLKSHYSNDKEVGFTWVDGASFSTKKLSVGKYTAKIVDKNGKVIAKKSFKILGKSNKKNAYKKFTLKLKKPEKTTSKTIKGNHIYAFYKYRNQGQAGRGVCIDSYGKGGPGTLKGIKLIKAKIYFKSNNGNTKVKTKKFDKYGFAKSNLISGYKPFKVVVFYK